MSEVILEFIQPYRALAYDDAALEKLIGLGVVAWNVALLPSNQREDALDDLATDLFRRETSITKLSNSIRKWIGVGRRAETKKEAAEVRDFKEIIYEMVEHKLRRFARNRRFIVSYHTEIKGDDVRVFVASTLEGINLK
jgi:Trm5-related predicted tRNA methylase